MAHLELEILITHLMVTNFISLNVVLVRVKASGLLCVLFNITMTSTGRHCLELGAIIIKDLVAMPTRSTGLGR